MSVFRCVLVSACLVVAALFVGACAPAEDTDAAVTVPTSEPGAETAPAVEVAEPDVDALIGSTWAIADYTVTFEADGVVRFNSGSEGTWTRADDTITISVAGEETILRVDGDTLTHNGMALEQQ